MKSARDWLEEHSSLPPCMLANFGDCECAPKKDGCDVLEGLFRFIQRDAIRAAAEKANCSCAPNSRAGCNEPGCGDDYYRDILSLLPEE